MRSISGENDVECRELGMFSANVVKIQQSRTLDSEKWRQKNGPKQQKNRPDNMQYTDAPVTYIQGKTRNTSKLKR